MTLGRGIGARRGGGDHFRVVVSPHTRILVPLLFALLALMLLTGGVR